LSDKVIIMDKVIRQINFNTYWSHIYCNWITIIIIIVSFICM